MNKTFAPFAKPMYVMLKSVGSACNLKCEYCYYLEKENLYPSAKGQLMSDALLDKFTEQYINSQTQSEILFTWHGGETLLRPISFYKKALEFQKKYGRGRKIDNVIQTNGTLLNDAWCEFFKENNFLVGISIDGPQEFHDEYRRNKGGQPTFVKVMKGINLLKKHGVEFNAMAVVNDFNADYPIEFYNFFKQIDCRYIQFAPIVERIGNRTDGLKLSAPHEEATLTDFSVKPVQWGKFLCALFDEWIKEDVGKFYIQMFDSTLANWIGVQPGVCTLAKHCGHAGVMEFNGDVYSCDHFVFPEYKLGNINNESLASMMYSERQLKFGTDKHDTLPRQCKECEFLFACNGECPKNRFAFTKDGEPGLNYLCAGWKMFYNHVAPYMDFMKNELMNERPPANVMEWARNRYVR
ncbi:MAG: anaerobic sulfatase-maturation protein [Paludibacteraceae bacterium]|nr:anaerobic sulfatase-maturation protein [Paludibacteraceae bacterium]